MTFLLLTEDEKQGEALAARLQLLDQRNLCLIIRPEEADTALHTVQVDRVIAPRALPLPVSLAGVPCVPWPDGPVTQAWLETVLPD